MTERTEGQGGQSASAEPPGPPGASPPPVGGPWPPPSGQPAGDGRVRPPGDPTRRPEFEPPPPWAAPLPPEEVQPVNPWSPTPTLASTEEQARHRRIGPLIAIVAATALVAGALGAGAGLWAGPRLFDQPVTSAASEEPTDDFGDEQAAFPEPQDVATVADSVLPSVVHVKVNARGQQGAGSGLVLSKDGYILTNNHVIAPAAEDGQITLVFHDSTEVSAEVTGRSPSYDLAVLEVTDTDAVDLRPVALGESDSVKVGEPIVAIGAPLGLAGTVTSGIISAKNRPVTAGGQGESSFINALQLDAAINPGNSGGPLVNLQAEVVGVNSAIATLNSGALGENGQQGNIGLGFAIPIDQARRTAEQIIENGFAVYPVIGVHVDPSFGGEGARVSQVQPDGAAAEAGLEAGDLITAIDGQRVSAADELIVLIRSRVPGESAELTYRRGGQERSTTVTFDEETG